MFCPVCHILFSVFPSVLQRHLRLHIFLFVSDQFAFRPSSLSELVLSHMAPPGEITDTQIGVATWLFLWCIASSFAGSLVTMGLHQHADRWNLVPYTGPRASLPHTAMFPVGKRKNPQKPPLSNEEQRPNDTYAAEWKMSRMGVYHNDFHNGYSAKIRRHQLPPRDPLLDKCQEWTAKRSGC